MTNYSFPYWNQQLQARMLHTYIYSQTQLILSTVKRKKKTKNKTKKTDKEKQTLDKKKGRGINKKENKTS